MTIADDSLHSRRDEIAFRGEMLGKAKTRATEIGREQREAFADILRNLEALAGDGIAIDPGQVTFEDDVDQAAWKRFCTPTALRGGLDPPIMAHEETIIRAVQ